MNSECQRDYMQSSFTPSQEAVDNLNAIRAANGLSLFQREDIKTAGDWFRVCDENDGVAENKTQPETKR